MAYWEKQALAYQADNKRKLNRLAAETKKSQGEWKQQMDAYFKKISEHVQKIGGENKKHIQLSCHVNMPSNNLKPSSGATDSPHRETDERKLIQVFEGSGRPRVRRCRFRSHQTYWRRCQRRRLRLKLARTLQRACRRLRTTKQALRRNTGSGAPPKRTQKRSNKTIASDLRVGTFNAPSLKAF